MSEIREAKFVYTADVKDLESAKKAVDELTRRNSELAAEASKAESAIKKEGEAVKKASEEGVKATATFRDKLTEFFQSKRAAFDAEPVKEFGSMVKGQVPQVEKLQGALGMLKLALSPIGLAFTAIVVAISAVIAYFKQTEKGADQLAMIMGGLEGVLKVLMRAFVQLGEAIINPLDTLKKLGNAIADFIKNPIEGLRSIKQGFADIANEIRNAAKEGVALARMMDDLEDAQLNVSMANEKTETTIQRLIRQLKNKSLTLEQQREIIRKLEVAERERFERNKALVEQEIEIEKKRFLQFAGNSKQTLEFLALLDKGIFDSSKLEGIANTEKAKSLVDLYNKREQIMRQSLLLEDKIDNFKAMIDERERIREEQLTKKKEEEMRKRQEQMEKELEMKRKMEDIAVMMIEDELLREQAKISLRYERQREELQKQGLLNAELAQRLILEEEEAKSKVLKELQEKRRQESLKARELDIQMIKDAGEREIEQLKLEYERKIAAIPEYYEKRNELIAFYEQELTEKMRQAQEQRALNEQTALLNSETLAQQHAQNVIAQAQSFVEAFKAMGAEMDAFSAALFVAEKANAISRVLTEKAKADMAVVAQAALLPPGASQAYLVKGKLTNAIQAALSISTIVAQTFKGLQSFAKGGYTGEGLIKDSTGERIAGVVHEKEFVFDKEKTRRLRGVFEAIHHGIISPEEVIVALNFRKDTKENVENKQQQVITLQPVLDAEGYSEYIVANNQRKHRIKAKYR
jgi:hypothetical protein